ncbi:MAG: PspC domain-containing protein, partial [FCB group bacterium]|nr:PspC domain-containing protein [FCB group bacterium]
MSNAESSAEEQLDALLRDGRISADDYDTLRQAMSKGAVEDVERRRADRARLVKKWEGRQLGGVCAGLADFFGLDAWNLRAVFVLALLLTGGTAVVVYLVLYFSLPWEKRDEVSLAVKRKRRANARPFLLWLVALWVLGIFFHFLVMPSIADVVSAFGGPLSAPFLHLLRVGALWGTPVGVALQTLFLALVYFLFWISPERGMARRWIPRGLMIG